MVAYRNSTQIVAQMLTAAAESGQSGIKTTHLLTKSNLSHGRLSKFVKNLIGSGLINKIDYDGKNTFVITQKGRTYLDEYQKFTNLAGSFGLDM
jgi:predicted transcriptional regulator